MLTLSILWIGLLSISCVIGVAVINRLQGNSFQRIGDTLILSLWLGIGLLSITLLAVSLVFPLTPLVGLAVGGTLTAISLSIPKNRQSVRKIFSKITIKLLIGFALVTILITINVSRRVVWYDAGLYHFQMIKWLSEFGTVNGLALLHFRFGVTSSWFALVAPFNWNIFENRLGTLTGGLVALLMVIQIFIGFRRLWHNKGSFTDSFLALSSWMGLSLLIWMDILRSPSPDVPILSLILVISWSMMVINNSQTSNFDFSKQFLLNHRLVPLMLSAFAVTIKLSAVPLLLITSIYYIIDQSYIFKRIIIVCLFSTLILLPLFLAGLVTSGCPLFPSSLGCLNFPWSMELEQIRHIAQIHVNNTITYESDQRSNFLMAALYFANNYRQLVALSIVSCLSLPIFKYSLRDEAIIFLKKNWIVIALAILGISFVLFKAPRLRLAMGYLLILPSLFLATVNYYNTQLTKVILASVALIGTLLSLGRNADFHILARPLTLVILIALGLVLFLKIELSKKFSIVVVTMLLLAIAVKSHLYVHPYYQRIFLWLPPDMNRNIPVLEQHSNDVTYYVPEKGSQCWFNTLPCSSSKKPRQIRLRIPQKGIGGGFIRSSSDN